MYITDLKEGTYKFVGRLNFKCNESGDLICFTKDLESQEFEVSEEDTKSTTITTRENVNGYEYAMWGDVSGPISITFTRDNTASLHVKIGDKIAYFTGWAQVIKKGKSEDILSQHWMSEIKAGEVTNISENNATVNGIEIPRDHILKILD